MNPEIFVRIGPPGTGKTTHMINSASEAAARYGTSGVLVCSLTRAAAAEARGRESPIPHDRIGTLHAHCYRALGAPPLAEAHLANWNEHAAGWALSANSGVRSVEDGDQELPEIATDADRCCADYTLQRARLTPRERWHPDTAKFATQFEGWKSANGYLDFQDLIDVAYHDLNEAPGRPMAMYLDEGQDSSAAEWALLAKWARRSRLVATTDPDQCIYEWRGADPDFIATCAIPDERVRVLEQSYRVPRAVRDYALRWIAQIPGRRPVTYLPRDADGQVRRLPVPFARAEELLADAEQYLAAGKRVMFLASCGYLLSPLLACLRKNGTPFHNPYRVKQGAWNPLAKRRGISVGARLHAFCVTPGTPWSPKQARLWIGDCQAEGLLKRGAKTLLDDLAGQEPQASQPLNDEALGQLFGADGAWAALQAGWAADLDWLAARLLASRATVWRFPLAVVRGRGLSALREPPRIIPGTIHSVKGGESDIVYVCPELSPAAMREWTSAGRGRDAIMRLFYVALTRARETVVLCRGGENAIRWR